jgi:hypothetical protein
LLITPFRRRHAEALAETAVKIGDAVEAGIMGDAADFLGLIARADQQSAR